MNMLRFLLILPLSVLHADEEYGCLWWAHGNPYYYNYRSVTGDNIPEDYPGRQQVLCCHTGRYGFAIDTLNLNALRTGTFNTWMPYAAPIGKVDRALSSFPEIKLSMEVHAKGKIYRCTGRPPKSEAIVFPVRFIAYGRFFQHISINALRFQDAMGNTLDVEGRLEIAAWPDTLILTGYLNPKGQKPNKFILRCGDQTAEHAFTQNSYANAVASLSLIQGDPVSEDKVHMATADRQTQVRTTYSRTQGAWLVKIRDPGWSNRSGTYYPEEHLDRLDRWPFALTNASNKAKSFRLLFDTPPRNITGYTPMVLEKDGRPSGIPVQISKNWHRGKKPLQYQGPWVTSATVITVPPGSTRHYQFAMAYARWGGVPAASHAQLSLIGWGHNMFWDECAIGSFGESICFEPGRTQRRSFITDVRPLMVHGKPGDGPARARKKWSWTGNVGGGDFLVLFDGRSRYVPMIKTRGRYYSYGPNLTRVSYDEMSPDGSILATYTVGLARADDHVRSFQHVRYDVRRPMPFSRLAFCQMPADYYNDMKYRKTALGHAGGLTAEWPVRTGSWTYDRRCIPMTGRQPWISLHDVPPDEKVTQAARGLIIRKWRAVLGGKPCAVPHLSTYMTEWHKRNFRVAAELSPPPGLNKLEPGDFVEALIEQVVLPSKPDSYYGPDKAFKTALAQSANTWRLVHREAAGNDLVIAMKEGRLNSHYPVDIAVSKDQRAAFTVSGGVGYVPLTFSGIADDGQDASWSPKLYRVLQGKMALVDQSVNGHDFWQKDYDAESDTWRITYNVSLDKLRSQTSHPTEAKTEFVFFRHKGKAMQNVIVCKEKNRFAGWPANHGIWAWGDEIVVGFTLGYHDDDKIGGHPMDADRPVVHRQARSLDGGLTWTVETPNYLDEQGKPKPLTQPEGGMDFRHPHFALIFLKEGSNHGYSSFCWSNDRCKTWQGPFRLPAFNRKGIFARTDYIINGRQDLFAFLTAARDGGGEGWPFCARTRDGGKTWTHMGWIGKQPGKGGYAIMPSTLRLKNGTLLSMIRRRGVMSDGGRRWWLEALLSRDDGRTWTLLPDPRIDNAGNPAHMIRLRDGRIVLTYGWRHAPYGIRARTSRDEGATWSDEIILRRDGHSWDLGYPRTVQRADGKCVTAYYFNDASGKERYIAVTIWDLPAD